MFIHRFLETDLTMRLAPEQIAVIRNVVQEEAGAGARVRLFGSRLDVLAAPNLLRSNIHQVAEREGRIL